MSDTVIATILNNLYDQLVAETEIAARIADGSLRVTDGAILNDLSTQTLMTIGGMPITDDGLSEATSEWDWNAMGVDGAHADVDEIWHIPCGIETVLGNGDMRAARTLTFNIFTHTVAFLRNTSLSIPQVMWCKPQLSVVRQTQTADGAEVLIGMSAHVQTRI